MDWFRTIISVVHVLAGSAWFGAMVYSLFVLQPRARLFFKDPSQFEEFVAFVAHRSRWKVLSGMGFIAVTGLILFLFDYKSHSRLYTIIIGTKSVLFVLAVGLFCFVSWKLWPARCLASANEIPKFQQRFRLIGVILLILAATMMILGLLSSKV
jgi:putative copper export protein